MEIELSMKILDMDVHQLSKILEQFKMTDIDAYNILLESIEDNF